MMAEVRVLHVVPDLCVEGGGQSSACFNLALSLVGVCEEVSIFFKKARGVTWLEGAGPITGLNIFPYTGKIFRIPYAIYGIIRSQNINIIHLHGLWLPIFLCAFIAAKIAGIKIVISPHGMLLPWDLRRKKIKKWLAMMVYQGWILRNVDGFIASSEAEHDSIDSLGLKTPIAIIPIAILDSPQYPELDLRPPGFKTALFVGRINHGKGLHLLIEAWAQIRVNVGDRLLIAGKATTEEELSYFDRLTTAVKKHRLESSILFVGLVEGRQKEELFKSASFLVLPTFSENFGMVIAEAMSFGLPVITTHGAPWRDIEVNQCGWWVPIGVKYLTDALADALSKSSRELSEMGARGRELFDRKYESSSVARETNFAYSTYIELPKNK
ncbi:glycosyltransferase [Polynucleobacter sp. 86C-FISCH]|uniref:glycosyltransferase n=1 Tax=Polynucleobacter sp. 86C-FISCH TaxID=2689101 RepID=UPI001C0C7A97|nr:glycosyltransferase [Polynucleobacter sp. 86C-FISCH]MBU3596014.1 glycosyltransferase [Polynucleobacter sp. 86C-FISCH]